MSGFNEASVVQMPIVDLLVAGGWKYMPADQLRRANASVIIEARARAAIERLNPSLAGRPDRVDEVLRHLRMTVIDGADLGLVRANQALLAWLRGRNTVQLTDPVRDVPVALLDFAHPGNNEFLVTDEVVYGKIGDSARFDIVLWVNGLPLVVGETKTRFDAKKTWVLGAHDIREHYEVERRPFFVPNLLSFATEGKEFRYGAVRAPLNRWERWGATESAATLDGWKRVKLSVESLLAPKTVLQLIRDFVLYETIVTNGVPQLVKILPRYFQFEAVESIARRANEPGPQKGLVYQTQGSGKTLAMSYAAAKLIRDSRLKNPTIIAIADRVQLVRQTFDQFHAAGMPRLTEATSAAHLRKLLMSDERGIIFTTVHKFAGAGHLNDRENIIVLVDEAHRTQEGTFGQQMRASLPNASFFAFTGTPIADLTRNTFALFGDDRDPGKALNTYDSDRSIADGTTVPMRVSARMVNFHIDQKRLDEAFEELAADEELDETEKEFIAARLSRVSTLIANPERIRAVCKDIVEHFYSTVDPLGMKAQIVVYNRAMCAAYHEVLSEMLAERGEDRASVVMSVAAKDEPAFAAHELTDVQEEALLNRFRNTSDPLKFLIVTSKLGTGFNAPIEGVLYLDRPLKLHTLFQTITRTNRPWSHPETAQPKAYGLIVDYIGLGDGFARAMKPNDPDVPQAEIDDTGLVDQFEWELDALLDRFAGIDRLTMNFATLEAAIERVPHGPVRDRFADQFALVAGIWEALAPDTRLEPRRHDYLWVAKVYAAITPSDGDSALLWARLGAKTLALVHEHISNVQVRNPLFDVVIADERTVQRLINEGLLDGAEAPEVISKSAEQIMDSIAVRIAKRRAGHDHPVYKALAERLERLRLAELARSEDSLEFLREIFTVARDFKIAEKADDDGSLALLPDPRKGALTQIFEEFKPRDATVIIADVVRSVDQIVIDVGFDGWVRTLEGERDVRVELRKKLRRFKLPVKGELFDRAYEYIAENY
ncbi:HsdR family type I site-specific deoxyribonuclease [Cryobacterium sp. PH31-L1]|uniref:type I restriction endonuclease subunit R n=1 Tax=Cryobacterium sp. PH31-L1 TaxID=3046199 RepID=UPI0024B8B1ED|nr:HsdR family type I site-specific deoxyribonuclease [Cryobacterium sp. PH31-L1]MDJ0379081.1 HsdR family type I site-specific deoxyribonuclease [Cryobacterium sp. PH31-L1]